MTLFFLWSPNVDLYFNKFNYGIETFVIPWNQLSYPCVVEICRLRLESCVTLISSCQPENADADRTGIFSGVRKDGPQLSMLIPCALLCVLVSCCFGTHLVRYFLNKCSVTILCDRERKMTASTTDEFRSAPCSANIRTLSQTAPHSLRELD